jgi:DNA replication and repair protein RecF
MSGGPSGRERTLFDDRHIGVASLGSRLPIITFVPEDREIVMGIPTNRREYLDNIMVRINPSMQRTLSRATKLLKQRQNLIRSHKPDLTSLDIFDHELSQESIKIASDRELLLDHLQEKVEAFNEYISGHNESIKFRYIRSWKKDPFGELVEARSYDVARGSTSVGFHRDDFFIEMNGLPAKSTASQGQVRSLALALRIGSADVIQRKIYEPPILLLDDVFAEFDRERSGRLFHLVEKYQTFATHTEKPAFKDDWLIFDVHGGHVVSH